MDTRNRLKNDWSVLNLNVTWFCPVKCSYCHVTSKGSHDDKFILPEETLIKQCRVAKKLGVKEYRFSGGEPLSLGDTLFKYADIVYRESGKKPVVLTSGAYIDKKWLEKAKGKFSGIYISIENPLGPLQTVIDSTKMLKLIKENHSPELPFKYGLTLMSADQFKNIGKIFELFYKNVEKKFMPQFEYPCLKDFIVPTNEELNDIYKETRKLFKKHGIISYYFVNIIGSLSFLNQKIFRVVANLNPDGRFDVDTSMLGAFKTRYSWLDYSIEREKISDVCQKCEWIDCCRQHGVGLMYDWCGLRKAIFKGMYDGLDDRE